MHPHLIPILALLSTTVASSAELSGLASVARSVVGAAQGVYVEAADGTVLLAQAADQPVHPASVSKVPTTLALLRKFGPEHRFVTTFESSGRIHDGTLDGDIVVASDGDPCFVDENALLVVKRLNELGVRRVAGTLRARGSLTFDWQSDPDAERLRQVMSGMAPAAAWTAVRELDDANATASAGTSPTPPAVQFANANSDAKPGAALPVARILIVHHSQPLLSLAKSLNDYSNNIFKPLADAAGGASAVESLARSVLPAAMRSEVTLGDGAGTDPSNRLSPRAAVKLLRALEQELALTGHGLFDILPVAGVDAGTLHDRLNAPNEVGRIVGKTGTFGDYGASALIGAISTSDRGVVYFAILNHGIAVSEARHRQDRFARALLMRLHSRAWNYQPDVRPAVARAEVLSTP
ncbi:MAG TPA: D-alanyl-D-alanine carboxypeptidase [Steroidobacteraceae bacterium]|nr:D-alanyl-D-alanine carboxypeptidase [Steroidobacteraceae bacterium]